jgi:hypothetical protein
LVRNAQQYFDRSSDAVQIKNLCLSPVLFNLMTKEGSDKFDSGFHDSAMDAILMAADLVIDLTLMMTELAICPTLAKSDASSGQPLTFSSLKSLIIAMEGMQNLVIPGLSLALKNFYCVPIQIHGAIQDEGTPAQYFLPIRPHLTLANMESLIASLSGEYDGIIHLNRNKVPYAKFTRDMVKPLKPVSLVSTHAHPICRHVIIADQPTGAHLYEIDETTGINHYQPYGVGETYQALALMRNQDLADSPKFLSAVIAAAANKTSLEYVGKDGSSGWTAAPDTSDDFIYVAGHAYYFGGGSENYWAMNRNFSTVPVLQNSTPCTVAGWNNRLVGYLTRHANGTGPIIRGMPILPDGVTRSPKQARGGRGQTTTPPNNGGGGNVPFAPGGNPSDPSDPYNMTPPGSTAQAVQNLLSGGGNQADALAVVDQALDFSGGFGLAGSLGNLVSDFITDNWSNWWN